MLKWINFGQIGGVKQNLWKKNQLFLQCVQKACFHSLGIRLINQFVLNFPKTFQIFRSFPSGVPVILDLPLVIQYQQNLGLLLFLVLLGHLVLPSNWTQTNLKKNLFESHDRLWPYARFNRKTLFHESICMRAIRDGASRARKSLTDRKWIKRGQGAFEKKAYY